MTVAAGAYAQGVLQLITYGGTSGNTMGILVNSYAGNTAVISNKYSSTAKTITLPNTIALVPGTNALDGAVLAKPTAEQLAAFGLGADPAAAATQVGLYVGAKGETDPLKFFKAGASGKFAVGSFAGVVTSSTGGNRQTTGANAVSGYTATFQPNDEVAAQVRGWVSCEGTPVYATYEELVAAAAAGVGRGYAGGTAVVTAKAGSGTTPGTANFGNAPWFLTPVPEPSVVGLGLLGLAGMFFIRRRK